MTKVLDLADIQGNILRVYGKQGYGCARFLFFHVADASAGRRFTDAVRKRVTTAARWENDGEDAPRARKYPKLKDVARARSQPDYPGRVTIKKPDVTFNIAFTFYGLYALEVPTRTLRAMPDEFIDGMAARASILGDDPFLERNDPIWRKNQGEGHVHIMIALNAGLNPDGTPQAALAEATAWLLARRDEAKGGVTLLSGHGPAQAAGGKVVQSDWQDAAFRLARQPDGTMLPMGKEHFGFSDGFGDPVFEGQYPDYLQSLRVRGGGKIEPDQSWAPLATGEFLLGHPDEAQENPGVAMPIEFSRNGTFTAWRKLHENVGSFDAYFDKTAQDFASFRQISPKQARETILAKMAGRWSDGVPLMAAPTFDDWKKFQDRVAAAAQGKNAEELAKIADDYVSFKFREDPHGFKCPVASHVRRVNTRDMLDPRYDSDKPSDWNGSVLNNRRRILRRGLPYGGAGGTRSDGGEQGIIFMAVCSSLFRQFEFVQQQWLQYGLDFNAGNDTCPLLGNRAASAKFVIPANPATNETPFICDAIPQLVEPRGGEYLFVPSMTALRMIAMGIVDPT